MKKSEVLKGFFNYAFIAFFGTISYVFINYKKLEIYETSVLVCVAFACALFIFLISDGASDE